MAAPFFKVLDMKNYSGWILIIVLFLTHVSFSQNERVQDRELRMLQATLESQEISIPQTKASSQIFIRQVGSENNIYTRLNAEKSNAQFLQNGYKNDLFLNIDAKTFQGKVNQVGDFNRISDNVYAPYDKIELNLTQRGDGHEFQRFGSNSIGNKLKFEMTGNSQTIIVRNF